MKAFLVRGTFRMARDWTKFAKEVAAETPEAAVERVMSDFGSKHRVKRSYIQIKEVTPVPLEQVRDPVVRFQAGGEP
ncbi:MAG TPA: 50S ribosomal protein L18Ae [Thermoplasmata archaeon]|jgi:large subunit ribosomal protein LX|nr:50S ribosomal protein L18Ae [Thermoplasmata archaeon]